MPCLNEAETLSKCIEKAKLWLDNSGISGEVLIADNGSTDGSKNIAREMGARVIEVDERGYGSALFYGCQAAKGHFIVMGDADDSYDFSAILPFVEKLNEGFDLVMGNRFLGGIAKGAMPFKNRYIGNPFLTFVGQKLFGCPVGDFHCGLRGIKKAAFLRMDLRTTGMEFASEMVIKANIFGMKIAEVPATLSKDGRSRPPHLRPWRDGWRHLRFMFLFSPKWLFWLPGLSIFICCLCFYLLLFIGPLSIGSFVFDIHTLFYVQSGIIIGFLSMVFGVTIRMFGMREGLLPHHHLLELIRKSSFLEVGAILSFLIFVFGVYLALHLVAIWGGMGFGNLELGLLLRTLSLSTLLITVGGIGFLASLVMGFMGLPTRKHPD